MEVIEQQKSNQALWYLVGSSLVLGVLHNFLFWDNRHYGINYPIFVLAAIVCAWLLTKKQQYVLNKSSYFLAGTALLFSVFVGVHSSALLSFFNILGSFLLLCVLAATTQGKQLRDYLPSDYLLSVFRPLWFIVPFFKACGEVFAFRKIATSHPMAREVIRGVFMAVIAVGVFALLFSSADAVFKSRLSSLFTFSLNGVYVARVILGLVVTAFFMGAFRYITQANLGIPVPTPPEKARSLGVVETSILLGSICAIVLVFLVLQVTYLFGGQEHVTRLGLEYAEYARSGFAQIVMASILAYMIISVAERQVVKAAAGHVNAFKILSTVLVLEVVAILVSAWSRLSLYEHAYGFTNIRLYSHSLMVWIGVALVLLTVHIFTSGTRQKFARYTFGSVVLLLLVMNVLNPEAFIAKKNLERFHQTGKLDTLYLASLSEDAIPVTAPLLYGPDSAAKGEYSQFLYNKMRTDKRENQKWQSWSLSRSRAKKLLEQQIQIYHSRSSQFDQSYPGDPSDF